MAFGEKARAIRRLEKRVAACETHGPFIPLAEEIGRRAAALAAESQTDMVTIVDAVVRELTEAKKREILDASFSALPPKDRFAVLERHFTDAEMEAALAAEGDRLVIRDETERGIQGLRQECIDYRRINLAGVPQGSQIRFDLYDANDLQEERSPRRLLETRLRDRVVTAASLGGGDFQILSDCVGQHTGGGPNPEFDAHEIVRLGGTLADGVDTAHHVYYGSGLNCLVDGKPFTLSIDHSRSSHHMDLALGSVEVNGQQVMGPQMLPKRV